MYRQFCKHKEFLVKVQFTKRRKKRRRIVNTVKIWFWFPKCLVTLCWEEKNVFGSRKMYLSVHLLYTGVQKCLWLLSAWKLGAFYTHQWLLVWKSQSWLQEPFAGSHCWNCVPLPESSMPCAILAQGGCSALLDCLECWRDGINAFFENIFNKHYSLIYTIWV